MKRFLIPLALFLVLVGFLAIGLNRDPHEVPSPLVGKPAPDFRLEVLAEPGRTFTPADMRGKVWLLNVWASWCPNCKDEHPYLLDMKQKGVVPVIGLNYKDKRDLGLDVLRKTGDPYTINAFDPEGKAALDWGVYGAPETFLIDRDGVIRAKHIGPITPEIVERKFAPFFR